MSFEVTERDLMGRIGRLKTKSGTVETPLLLPVINPLIQPISPREMEREFGCEALITNAYLLKKNFREEVTARGVHDFLGFDKVVVTDSGAYQILRYGGVETTPEEIARFEEEIDTDIAVILDIPTGWNAKRETAEYTVEETLRRASTTLSSLNRRDILWVGPVQGGNHLDLVAKAASEIGKMNFQVYALGSPTQVMERYLFDTLVDMIMAAKKNLPAEKPLHLFGAGHPFMFSFAVATGCDIFDSAAYALYTKQGRYMTEYGTYKLENLEYFPCTCRVCSKYTPQELRQTPIDERRVLLAWHNLETCFTEIKRIKQAIKEGRLWELLELRARSHPSLLQALKALKNHKEYLEAQSPMSKERGLFYFDSAGLARPEITRYQDRIRGWAPPEQYRVLVLLPQPLSKPFHRSREYKRFFRVARKMLGEEFRRVHTCTYAVPFGVVPYELDEIYPLSQYESALPSDRETIDYVAKQVGGYITSHTGYEAVVFYNDMTDLGRKTRSACRRACAASGMSFLPLTYTGKSWSRKSLERLVNKVSETLQRQ